MASRKEGPLPHDVDLYRLLVESVRDYAIFLLDPDGNVLTWNRGAERIKQYRAEEIIGRHFSTFYPVEDLATNKPARELEIAIKEGAVEDEGWRIRKDGSRFWADVVITALRDESGTLRGFAKVTRDLTDRLHAAEELRRSEERLRLMIESVTDYAIFMLDPEGRVATWNAGAQRIKGYRPDEIIGQSFERFYPPEDVASGKPRRTLDRAREVGSASDEGFRVRKDGTRFWAGVRITSVRDGQGVLRGFAKVTRDLTQQRDAEEERVRLAQAQEALRLRDEFLSIASHELKTPLAALQLRLQALVRRIRGKGGDVEDHHHLDKALAQGWRLAALVENVLDVSRITGGVMKLSCESFDLAQMTREVCDSLADVAATAACPLRVEAKQPVLGTWDRARLGQVLTNLVTNALKYGAGKPIDVVLEKTEGGARISVRDRGFGVREEDRERIFDRFQRAVSERHFGGLGLGLYVSRQIVVAHGGTLTVESEPDVLTTFIVELPKESPKESPGH